MGDCCIRKFDQPYQIWNDYRAQGEEYEELRQYVKETPEEEIPENPHAKDKMQGESEGEETAIDSEKLRKINPDIVAWIRIEAVGIDYPVVQGPDNEFYLHHTFRGDKSIAGSIFMDYRNTPNFSDERTIIYGHNMRDGSMFAVLKHLKVEEKPMAVIVTENGVMESQLVSENYVGADDEIYQLIGESKKEGYAISRTLLLSTCSNDGRKRYIIQGML